MQNHLKLRIGCLAIATLCVVPHDANSAAPIGFSVVVPRNISRFPRSEGHFASRAAYRAQIRQQPILERPDRFGHVYGNSVRRVNRVRNTIRNG